MNLIILIVILAVLLAVILFSTDQTVSKEFQRKWPPITDDEFMKRCEPGTPREIALRVRRIVSKQLGIPYENIYPEQDFVNDLNTE